MWCVYEFVRRIECVCVSVTLSRSIVTNGVCLCVNGQMDVYPIVTNGVCLCVNGQMDVYPFTSHYKHVDVTI